MYGILHIHYINLLYKYIVSVTHLHSHEVQLSVPTKPLTEEPLGKVHLLCRGGGGWVGMKMP